MQIVYSDSSRASDGVIIFVFLPIKSIRIHMRFSVSNVSIVAKKFANGPFKTFTRSPSFNSILKSIPTSFVDNLMKRYDLSGKLIPIKKLQKGDQVTVLKGPFANFIATVEKYEADQRIWILMDLMGRKSKIQTPSDNLTLPD